MSSEPDIELTADSFTVSATEKRSLEGEYNMYTAHSKLEGELAEVLPRVKEDVSVVLDAETREAIEGELLRAHHALQDAVTTACDNRQTEAEWEEWPDDEEVEDDE